MTAVRRFQTLCGLPVTGEVDRHTWKCLCCHYALAAGDGTGNCQKGKNHL
ncbi:MAG: peptidoglycan-binding domain-containing protein [Oscillospiraceae bacterium]